MEIDYVEVEDLEVLQREISLMKKEIKEIKNIEDRIIDIENFLINYTRGNYDKYLKQINKKE